jgi:hypothetical protein
VRNSLFVCLFIIGCGPPAVERAPDPASICQSTRFQKQDYLSRSGFNYGDSWMMSWAADGRTFTNFSDGKLTATSPKQSNAILTIDDDPPNLTAASLKPVSGDPLRIASSWAHYIINTIVVKDTLYVGLIDFSPDGGLARSDDFGVTLQYNRAHPMWPASGPKFFAYPSFLQNGPGYSGNRDGYVYVYATDGNWGDANALRVARARTDADLLDPRSFAYYNGVDWSTDLSAAIDLLPTSRDLGGMQSIVYNSFFDRYFLITFGDTHNDNARMVLFDAPAPEGPWTHCGVITRGDALFVDEPLQTEIYNPSFNAKWIDPDGSMWISYSSCCADDQYSFNYGRISVTPRSMLPP